MRAGKTAQQLGKLCFSEDPSSVPSVPVRRSTASCSSNRKESDTFSGICTSLPNSHNVCAQTLTNTYTRIKITMNLKRELICFHLHLRSIYWRLAFTPGLSVVQFYSTSLGAWLPKPLFCSWKKNFFFVRLSFLADKDAQVTSPTKTKKNQEKQNKQQQQNPNTFLCSIY